LNPTCSITATSDSYTVNLSCTVPPLETDCTSLTLTETCSATLH
jgi:hypothetical protein